MPRDYKKEYQSYQGQPQQIKNRAKRNAARAKMKKKLGASAIRGKDIDHKKGIAAGNGAKNLRAISPSKNRSFPRTKTAKKK